jgi:geranylgeranyl diphosphate synthase type II
VTLAAYLDARRQAVDAALLRLLAAPPDSPALIVDAMRYSLMAGGKRLRPLLALASEETVSGRDEHEWTPAASLALPAACAIEMIHTYSLVHDDLPAMDNDDLRRGRPTSHVMYGEGMAILAGDGLQADAFRLMAREPESTDLHIAARKLRTLLAVAEAAGSAGMVGGQAIDLSAEPGRPRGQAGTSIGPLDATTLADMHARKTGALIRAAVVAGATMAGAEPPTVEALDRYGREIGLAFQIVDDVLDVEGASADLGKTLGKDAASGKPTYVALYGLDESHRLAAGCLSRAGDALADAGFSDSRLAGIARWVVERRT